MGEFFTERKSRAKGGEELLSVTIANGVIRQADSDKRDARPKIKAIISR
jgi:type I restriction enzyme S subunit